jgi:SPP1 gp7 family putative phage head morphogenesis protein
VGAGVSLFDAMFKAAPSLAQQIYPLGLERRWTRVPTREKSELPELAHRNPRLDPVSFIARSVASTPWKLYNKNDIRNNVQSAVPLDRHKFYDVMDLPVRRYPEIDLWALIFMTDALWRLVGEFFWWKYRDGDRANSPVVQLYPMPAAWIAQIPTKGMPYYMVYPFGVVAGQAFPVAPSDIVYFKYTDLTDPYSRGRGMSEPIIDTVSTDEYAAKFQKNTMYNDGTPPFVVRLPGADKGELEAASQNWMDKVGGWVQNRKPAFVGWPDSAKIETLGMAPKELDLIESRKFLRDEANQHYGVPPELMGIIENSNRATIESAEYLFAKHALSNDLHFLERTINRQLLWPDFDANAVMRFDEVVDKDKDFQQKVMSTVPGPAVLVDEWRALASLPPLPDGKGQVRILNPVTQVESPIEEDLSGVTVEVEESEDEVEIEDQEEEDAQVEVEPTEDEQDKSVTIAPSMTFVLRTKSGSARGARERAVWKSFDSRARAYELAFISGVKQFADRQKERLIAHIGETVGEDDLKGLMDQFNEDSTIALRRALFHPYVNAMAEGSKHAMMTLGKEEKAVILATDPRFSTWVDDVGTKRVRGIDETTRDKLQRSISDAIKAGEGGRATRAGILDAVDDVYDDFTGARASMIARTETAASVNFGTVITYKDEGVKKKEWLATQDDRTREDHSDADGQVVGVDEDFHVGDDSMMMPGGGDDPGENINCRCTVLPVVGEEE